MTSPSLTAARMDALVRRGADLARLTTSPLGPSLEQSAALGAGAQHAAHDGAQQFGSVGSVGVVHVAMVRRGSDSCARQSAEREAVNE